ncbi:hypothetical protein [Candidatus Enterococcus murrayae]|uniref:Phage protein n=1 Tax=Candidatus Enterococcus murrayae TaxID=2815321 RepID=A0ABS3HBB0_9ENTE|nr:hypothetical protein [Enterococcus sp. MJM16]MBO0450748.1 hypothetical protein [Enterococcus sp. MJM16]
MNFELLLSFLSIGGTLIGTFSGIVISNKLTVYRIEQLEKKVEKHNNVIERTYKLEGRMTEAEHDLRDMKGGDK